AAVAAGADAVVVNQRPKSARYVPVERAMELASGLPAFVTPVLLFVDEVPQRVLECLERLPNALAQFHGDETPEQCLASTGNGRHSYLRVARIPLNDVPFDLVKFALEHHAARAILLDAHVEGYGGAGKAFDWSRLPPS